jgi:autotransporter-associated beta strand protein
VNNGELSFNLNTTVNLDKEISGNGSFTQQGNGTVVLTKNNTYSGVTTISNGTLVVGNGTAEGSLGNTSNIVNNGSLAFNLNATVNLDKVISGNGSLTQQGTGSLQLTANNNYSGVTTINGGSVVIGDGRSNGSIANTANVVNNGNLSFNRADEVVFDKAISGSGSFEQQGNGTLVLSTNNSYGGITTISNGTLVVGNGGNTGSLGSTTGVVNNGSLVFKRANEYAFSNIISGNGSLEQQGNGSLTLSAANTYAGVTNVSSGELIVTNAAALGDIAGNTVVNGGSLVVSGGIALANEAITLNGAGSNGAGALASRAGSNTVTGAVTLSGNAAISAELDSGLNISGAINGDKELAAYGGGNFSFAKIGNATAVAGINITAAAAVGFTDAVTSNQNISVVANSSVSLNGTMRAAGSMVRFDTTGTVTQTNNGNIVADRLALKGSGGNHTLTATTNNVSTLAADTGSFAYVNAGNLTIGQVNPEGVNATGPVSITTLSGNLVISENITTTDNSANALILNAGINSIAGNASGGDIVLSGAAITVGSGGTASFYSGSVAGTTALAASIGSSSGNFRYNSDETTKNFTLNITTGSYVIYREQPTVNLTALDARKMYNRQAWTGGVGYACANCANGDSFYTMVDYGGTSQGAINVGYYTITPDGNLMSRLGYAIGTLSAGTLIVSPEFDAGTAGKINKDDSAGKSDKSLNPGLLFVKVDKNLQPIESAAEVSSNTSTIQDLKILLVNGGLKEEKVPFISSSKKISRR